MADRVPRERALNLVDRVLTHLEPFTVRAVIAGSLRRGEELVKDVEVVAEPEMVGDGLFGDERLAIPEIQDLAHRLGSVQKGGSRYIQIADTLDSGITTDLFLVHPPADWGVQLAIRTGPAEFSRELVTRIKGRLWRCQDGWVRDDRGRRVPCPTEEDFFAAAQVPYMPPEERGAIRSGES